MYSIDNLAAPKNTGTSNIHINIATTALYNVANLPNVTLNIGSISSNTAAASPQSAAMLTCFTPTLAQSNSSSIPALSKSTQPTTALAAPFNTSVDNNNNDRNDKVIANQENST
jgi:hypothetical protein